MFDLTGKTALVTAAGQGIGRASALALAFAGAKVFATDINESALADMPSASVRITALRLDVLSSADVAAVAARTGPIDILFNCAGRVDGELFSTARRRCWRRHSISTSRHHCA